eukprot:2169462-Amphidinium_carterae.1
MLPYVLICWCFAPPDAVSTEALWECEAPLSQRADEKRGRSGNRLVLSLIHISEPTRPRLI